MIEIDILIWWREILEINLYENLNKTKWNATKSKKEGRGEGEKNSIENGFRFVVFKNFG